jgi:hypothetical protein
MSVLPDLSFYDLDPTTLPIDLPLNTGEDAAHSQGSTKLPATGEECLEKGTPRRCHASRPPGLSRWAPPVMSGCGEEWGRGSSD